MFPAGFEPAIPASERRQICALDGAASDVGGSNVPSVIVQTEQNYKRLNPF